MAECCETLVLIEQADDTVLLAESTTTETLTLLDDGTVLHSRDEVLQILETPAEDTMLVQTEEVTQVVTTVEQGPPGPPGAQGPAGGATLVPVGSTPISGHSAVAVNSAGLLVPADCTLAAHLGAVLGVVDRSWSPGEQAEAKTAFPLEHVGWSWTPGPVYVGAGQLVQILPPGALFCQVVGHALSATRVLVDLQPPISIA